MKPTFTRLALSCVATGTVLATASAEKIGNVEFSGFVKHIECREAPTEVNARVLPKDPTTALKKAAQRTPSRFIGWNAENPSLPMFTTKSSETGEKMDSVVGILLNGDLMSKQEFRFTENGRPLESLNYLPTADGRQFRYAGHYLYEYDDLGRLIAAEQTDVDNLNSCQRMEYVYNGNSPLYSLQIAYLMDQEGEWVPFQKAEYEFDENGNTTEETYSSWVDDVNDWVPVRKITATYDELNRMTSYFPYTWDGETGSWGNTAGDNGAQRFEYTQNGETALKAGYEWRDNEWVEYYHMVDTYNDAALIIKREHLYWNREKQDWSGAETWGRWDSEYFNSYELYDYDEYGRNTEMNVFNSQSGEYANTYRTVVTYAELENDETGVEKLNGSVKANGDFAPYSKTEQHFNKFGSECYYISYRDNQGEWVAQQEEIRYMDEYNWFLGGDYYRFANGVRKPDSKERFTYPDDFDPTLGYETPIEGRHWIGKGTDDWHLMKVDSFTWGPRDVMIGYVNYDYLQSDGHKTSGWENEFDFSADTSNIFLWPRSNNAAYLENKMLKSVEYSNPDYWNGNNEWMPAYSYTFTYYYSPRSESGIENVEVPAGVTEVERYDLLGRRISEPTAGINIVRYSDGSSRKVMVK